MKTNRVLFSILALCTCAFFTMGVSECQTTGNAKTDITNFWNSATVQTELSQIQTMAFDFVNDFLHSHLGGRTALKSTSPSVTTAKANYVAAIKAAHPNVPDAVIQNAVDAAFAKKLGN